ncbi:MAG: hypothetical protein KBD53_01645 [Candidatus Omnitrophica bacterium]|nr:hypothetical protein [Candidatus Omnitrophota bacterium]
MNVKPQSITAKTFRSYGKLIEYPDQNKKGTVRNLWRIIHRAPNKNGWRVAYLILRDRSIGRLECHPTSDETFEPIKNSALFFVSKTKNIDDIECFILDRPIILYKGIWHGLITQGNEAEIKITENLNISSRYWPFGFRIKNLTDLNRKRTRT